MFDWDFTKLPPEEHDNILNLYSRGQWNELMLLHNKYKLSGYEYCCSGWYPSIQLWYKHGIESGQIKSKENADD